MHLSSVRWAGIVVNYEAGPLLTACVTSLLADRSAGDADVVVVDNGSTDGSTRELQAAHPEVRVIVPGSNLGYGGGANRGIAVTQAPVVLACNPDTRVDPDAAAAALARFDTEADLGALGPMVMEEDGSVYPSARRVPSLVDSVGHAVLGGLWRSNPFTGRYRELDADPRVARDVDWVSGAAMWLRREALDSVGGFDDAYFMYVEDVDLCWRLRGAGWRVAYEPSARVVHRGGVSTARHPYKMIVRHHRSWLRFARKRYRGARRMLLAPAAAFLALRATILCSCRALSSRRRPSRAAAPVRRAPDE